MANLLDYLRWRGDLSLMSAPFNDVDNLILSAFSYFRLEEALSPGAVMTVREVCGALGEDPGVAGLIGQDDNREMLRLMGESARFADARVCHYRQETNPTLQKQFAAMTFLLPDKTVFVAYRGTDNTLVGWKEDFNLAVAFPVPAQVEALDYLQEMAERFRLPLRVGGHSKGGNLAVYAASFAPETVQERILRVYSNDGPGMPDTAVNSAGHLRILPKLRAIVPQFSIVGMLLKEHEDRVVVRSAASMVMQHDPFTWEVLGAGFVPAERQSPISLRIDSLLDEWLAGLSLEQRTELVETAFGVLDENRVTTVEQLGKSLLKNAGALILALRHLDGPTRQKVLQLAGGLLGTAVKRRDSKPVPKPPVFLRIRGAQVRRIRDWRG